MSPISASTFNLASGHFLVWWLYHLMGFGSNRFILAVVHCFHFLMVRWHQSLFTHPHSFLLTLENFHHHLFHHFKNQHRWRFPVKVRHFPWPASCSIHSWPSFAVPYWHLPMSLIVGCVFFFSFPSALAFYHVEFCRSLLAMFESQSGKLHMDIQCLENLNILFFQGLVLFFFFLKPLDLFEMLTFCIVNLGGCRSGNSVMENEVVGSEVGFWYLCLHWFLIFAA